MACIFQHLRTICFKFNNLCIYLCVLLLGWGGSWNLRSRYYFQNCLMDALQFTDSTALLSFWMCTYMCIQSSARYLLSLPLCHQSRFQCVSSTIHPVKWSTLSYMFWYRSVSFFSLFLLSLSSCALSQFIYKSECFIRKRPIKLSYHYINWLH